MTTRKTTSLSSASEPASLAEHLSAVLDGEAGGFEERRVLDELKSDGELRYKLSAYTLISESMRSSESSVIASSAFLAGIHEAINDEDEYHHVSLETKQTNATPNKTSGSWLKPIGGFALAASVAAIAVVSFQNYQQQLGTSDLLNASIDSSIKRDNGSLSITSAGGVADASNPVVVASGSDAVMAVPDLYQQADNRTRLLLKRYVDSHLQQASGTAFVPSVRVIAYAD